MAKAARSGGLFLGDVSKEDQATSLSPPPISKPPSSKPSSSASRSWSSIPRSASLAAVSNRPCPRSLPLPIADCDRYRRRRPGGTAHHPLRYLPRGMRPCRRRRIECGRAAPVTAHHPAHAVEQEGAADNAGSGRRGGTEERTSRPHWLRRHGLGAGRKSCGAPHAELCGAQSVVPTARSRRGAPPAAGAPTTRRACCRGSPARAQGARRCQARSRVRWMRASARLRASSCTSTVCTSE